MKTAYHCHFNMKPINLYLDPLKEHHLTRLKLVLNTLDKEKKYLVTVKEHKQTRTLNQNAYLWGVVYKIIAYETGSDTDSIHEDLKKEFGIKEERASIITGEISDHLRSTTKYNTFELTNYINNIKNWAITFLGVTIPEANNDLSINIYENKL